MESLFFHILAHYEWLIDSYMIDYFTKDQWKALPHSWQEAFMYYEPRDCVNLVSPTLYPTKSVLPLSILCLKNILGRLPSRTVINSTSSLADACGIRSDENAHFVNLSSTNCLRRKMKPKKLYEVDRVTTMAAILKEKDDGGKLFNTVIDIGAGMGHLARVMSMAFPDCEVVAVEQNSELIRRSVGLSRQVQNLCKDFRKPIHHREQVQAGFCGTVLQGLRDGDKALLIGLHPCGDLSASILRLFVRSQHVSAVILFGCCYHKLSTPNKNQRVGNDLFNPVSSGTFGFPLSRKFSSARISYAGRDLACHGNENFVGHLMKKSRGAFIAQCYRAVIEWLIGNHPDSSIREQASTIVTHSFDAPEDITFDEYLRAVLVKHPDVIRAVLEEVENDERAKLLVDSVHDEWRRFLVVHCLRLLFAPLIEHFMIMDRVEFIREHGHRAAVVPLFDAKISPRNLAIIAFKKNYDGQYAESQQW